MSLIPGTIGLALLGAITLLGVAIEAMALEVRAEAVDPAAARTFGTNSSIVHTISAHAFMPESDTDVSNLTYRGSSLARACNGGPCLLVAPVSLPAGAVLESFELDACDGSAIGQVRAEFIRVPAPTSAIQQVGLVQTGDAAISNPECALFPAPLTALTIDNRNNNYKVAVDLTGGNINTSFQAVRVFYRLQTSPAPVAATFDDVPTNHPFFALIEALAAAGITVGCSTTPPLFCPDTVVTRAQMAAFLARALGLHWAP
jgi:hypothetical protein